jgi:predicted metal-dependent phosphoesterase TrpH
MENFTTHLDLHTHSIISYDGGITEARYRRFFEDEKVFIAITDHNEISFAKNLHSQIGQQVIVGEEILTTDGEIIGLFLVDRIEPGLSANETIARIKQQHGLVYVPHPLEKTRKGISHKTLEAIAGKIDIIEVFNARSREPWLRPKLEQFANSHNIAQASSSDAHSASGFGTSFTNLSQNPTREILVDLLRKGQMAKQRAPLLSLLAPFRNKIRKKIKL